MLIFPFLNLTVIERGWCNFPDIHILFIRKDHFNKEFFQLFVLIAQKVLSCCTPSKTLRKVVACSQWDDSERNLSWGNAILMKFRDYPCDCPVTSTNDSQTFFLLLDVLFKQVEALFTMGFHVTKVNSYKVLYFFTGYVHQIMDRNLKGQT